LTALYTHTWYRVRTNDYCGLLPTEIPTVQWRCVILQVSYPAFIEIKLDDSVYFCVNINIHSTAHIGHGLNHHKMEQVGILIFTLWLNHI